MIDYLISNKSIIELLILSSIGLTSFVFILMVGQFPVFGVLTFSSEVIYATYEYAPRLFDLTPLQDQILGGVVMKLFNMVASLLIFGISFSAWYKTSEGA